MKHLKKLLAAALAMFVALAVATPAFAAGTPGITIKPNNVDADTESIAIEYTYYKILTASIDTDPTVGLDGKTTADGVVAYYVVNQAQATALKGTGLFNVEQVPGQAKWYVELKDSATTAEQIAAAFDNATFLANFTAETYTKAAGTADAVLPNITAGYYFIKSSLGTKIALQTLSPVTINEKNSYPTIDKTEAQIDGIAGIGDVLNYTITVTIPESVAAKPITITDTITKGLTLNTAVTVEGAVADPAYTSATFTLASTDATTQAKTYTLEIPAATVLANKGKTLSFKYTATVNEQSVVMEDEVNKAHLDYDHYTTVDRQVTTKSLAFDLQKVDGTDKTTVLAGAEFSLWTAQTEGAQILLVDVTPTDSTTKVYRVATAAEAAADGFKSAAIVAGEARIQGLNDATYYLQEDKAPAGYNKLTSRVAAQATEDTSTTTIDYKVENNKGTQLPSTGGMGTTLFYVVGGLMVAGAAIALIAKNRVNKIEA